MSAHDTADDLVRRWAENRDDRAAPTEFAEDDEPTCGDVFHSCACGRSPHSIGAHACECGGAWTRNHEVLRYPERIVDGPNAGQPIDSSGFDTDAFARALSMGYDPWMAAVCASPVRMAEKGPIEFR